MITLRNLLISFALLWVIPADAAGRFWVPAPVSGAISGTAGVCRLTVPGTNGYVTGNTVTVASVTGATGCNVTTTLTVIDGTHIELDGSTFGGVYVSGGLVSSGNWTATNTANWAATTGSTTVNQSVPGTADTATLDSLSGGGTVTVNTTVVIQSLTTSAFTGTLDFAANDNNVTLNTSAGFTDSGSGTHTINLGDGIWTFSAGGGSGIVWNSINTNLTLNANGSTLVFSAAGNTQMRWGGKTLNDVSITGAGRWSFNNSAATFSHLSISAGVQLYLASGVTYTVSNAPTWTGTRASPIILNSDVATGVPTLSVPSGTVSGDWIILGGITGSGGATFNATNALSYGTNTGWNINSGPSAGGGNKIICGSLQPRKLTWNDAGWKKCAA